MEVKVKISEGTESVYLLSQGECGGRRHGQTYVFPLHVEQNQRLLHQGILVPLPHFLLG